MHVISTPESEQTFVTPAYSQLLVNKRGIKVALSTLRSSDRKQPENLELCKLDTNPTFGFWGQVRRHLHTVECCVSIDPDMHS